MADIVHSIQTSAGAEKVYALVSTAAGFGAWWATDITEPSGTVDLGFFKRATVYRLRLLVNESPVQAEWICESGDEWNGTHIGFRLEPNKMGTLAWIFHTPSGKKPLLLA